MAARAVWCRGWCKGSDARQTWLRGVPAASVGVNESVAPQAEGSRRDGGRMAANPNVENLRIAMNLENDLATWLE
jgi:hypothetical protein